MLTINGKSQLGAATHGETSHYIRPDGVYATGVVQPTGGYRPIYDSQQVAIEFANSGALAGARNAQLLGNQLQLLGLRGTGIPIWQRVRLWWQGFMSKRQAASIVKAAVDAQAAATGQTKQEAAVTLFNTSLPADNVADQLPGSAPNGAVQQQMVNEAMAITGNPGTWQPGANAPTQSAQQAAGEIAYPVVALPGELTYDGANNRMTQSGAYAAANRFYAQNRSNVMPTANNRQSPVVTPSTVTAWGPSRRPTGLKGGRR